MDKGKASSLEETPTWAVSVVCLVFFLVSFIIDASLHHLTQFLKRRKRKSLNKALARIKTEMMILGFISLLLTILREAPLSKICVSEAVGNSFLPCKDPVESVEAAASSVTQISGSKSNATLPVEYSDETYCAAKGMVSLVSREGIMQLNMFISVLAVFHVLYCMLTMCLGTAKMRKWKAWEKETRTAEYQIDNDPRRFQLTCQTAFGQRHLKFWSDHPILLWPVCFIRQFSGSISKADYFTLRNGFITANIAHGTNFNFQKFLARAYDDDFEQVVGIRFWIWIFSINLFIFFSAHEFYSYYWLPFVPLVIVLVVGTKLEVIITKMCLESFNKSKSNVILGTLLVKPDNDLFWFGRPNWLLHLIQFILIQNSFQLAFFTWTWFEYGLRSCFNRETEDIAIRISMGVAVQLLCGYVTIPLYVLVSQMGSGMKRAVFTERIAEGLKHWHENARHNLSKDRCTSNPSSPDTHNTYLGNTEITEEADMAAGRPAIKSCEKNKKDEANPNIIMITRGTSYDGEISFGSSWKQVQSSSSKQIGDIDSIVEENASDHML